MIAKCFERLIVAHIKWSQPLWTRVNRRSHQPYTLYHLRALQQTGRYCRMLLLDFSSAFNTSVPANWCPNSQTISAEPSLGGPCISQDGQMCILHPQCTKGMWAEPCSVRPVQPSNMTNTIIKFADNTQSLAWSPLTTRLQRKSVAPNRLVPHQQLILHSSKAKETVVDFRQSRTELDPMYINYTQMLLHTYTQSTHAC